MAGLYLPQRGFVKHDLDIAFLVKAIGGPHLLYSLGKSHGLASWRTVKHHLKIPMLIPSIGIPSTDEINLNIFHLFWILMSSLLLTSHPVDVFLGMS